MKKIFSLSILFVLTFSTSAQHRESQNILQKLVWDDEMLTILLDTRFDGELSTGNEDGRELGFRAQTLKLWFAGEIVPGISYRVRHRLNKGDAPLRDQLTSATDHAWIAFNFGKRKQWTITAGKQSVKLGTFEFDYNFADIYLSTMINNDMDSYKTGVNAAYAFSGQKLNLQLVNSDETQFASYVYRNKALAAHFLWEGNLFDGVLRTRWGYGVFQHTKAKFYNWVTPGVQINIDKFTTELDYYFGERNMDYSNIVGDNGLSFVRDQSVSLNLKYDFGKWRPFIKGTWNQRHDNELEENIYKIMGIEAAVEFYPFSQKLIKDLRFHFAYSYTNTDFLGRYSNKNNHDTHTVILGMRWLFKAK